MAGALIIHGDRKPTATTNGDLDTLLVTAAHSPYPDHVLLFQQIQYACRYKDGPDKGQIKTKKNADGKVIAWICDPGDVGEITSYDQFGPPTWAQSARWTSINGEVLPTIAGVEAGSVQRLRLIHAGVRDTIKVQFRKKHAGAAPPTAGLTKQNLQQFLDSTCNGEVIPYQVVAADGLTMENTMTSDAITLQPGYRFDILAVFPEAGDYCMVETSKTQAASVARQDGPPNLLGFVSVTGSVRMPTRDVTKAMTDSLIKSATANIPAGTIRDQVVRDLNYVDPQTHLPAPRLTRFVPHPTVTDDEVKGVPEEHLVFFIGTPDSNTTLFEVGNSFDIEHRPGAPADYYQPKGVAAYDPNRIDRSLTLGTAQQWELRGYAVSHPFHIHVNPFQIVAILDPKGNDVSAPGYKEADGDNQFAGLRGVWKDTIFVKTDLTCYQCGTPSLADPPANYYRFIIRTRYERYIGEFVLHCHILDHEDQGMMQNVMIGISDGAGGMSHGHH
jgi:L-ascorbate oxidase